MTGLDFFWVCVIYIERCLCSINYNFNFKPFYDLLLFSLLISARGTYDLSGIRKLCREYKLMCAIIAMARIYHCPLEQRCIEFKWDKSVWLWYRCTDIVSTTNTTTIISKIIVIILLSLNLVIQVFKMLPGFFTIDGVLKGSVLEIFKVLSVVYLHMIMVWKYLVYF